MLHAFSGAVAHGVEQSLAFPFALLNVFPGAQGGFDDLDWPLINNWQAREIRTGADARQGLLEQVPNPVRWMESIRYLASQSVRRYVEVGAGSVLCGLLRNIDPALIGIKFNEPADLDRLLS